MKYLLLLLLCVFSLNLGAKGGGSFGGGRSSSFSSGRSSFGGSSRSSGTTSKSTGSGSSGRSWFGGSKSSTPSSTSGKSKPFTQSSRGMFGSSSTPRVSPSGKTIYTAKEALDVSPAVVRTSGEPISVYHYYYPSPMYGSGYSWLNYYFYYHMLGYHSYCYHQGGGLAQPRICAKQEDCAHGETCDMNKKQCVLRQGEWEQ